MSILNIAFVSFLCYDSKEGGIPLNTRIKEIRKELGLTQTQFGERLGVKGNTITQIENGNRGTSNQMVTAICREFNVRRLWLEEGIGPMRMEATEDDEIVDEVLAGEDEFIKAVIRGLLKLPAGGIK